MKSVSNAENAPVVVPCTQLPPDKSLYTMLYWILLIFLVVGFFYPVIGILAIVCMIAPVAMSIFKGRYWCGHFCPRGSYYDKLISKISRNKKIPRLVRSKPFRGFMLIFIFAMFGIQMYFAWGDWSEMGAVFWRIIFITTVVATVLGIIYSPRAWCTFCPMGTLSAMVAPRKHKDTFKNIHIDSGCVLCKRCSKVCPMQLTPYEAKDAVAGLLDPDCIKCGNCISQCPKQSMTMRKIKES